MNIYVASGRINHLLCCLTSWHMSVIIWDAQLVNFMLNLMSFPQIRERYLLSSLMKMVDSMLPVLKILWRRSILGRAGFPMRWSPSWVHRVVVCITSIPYLPLICFILFSLLMRKIYHALIWDFFYPFDDFCNTILKLWTSIVMIVIARSFILLKCFPFVINIAYYFE